MIILTICCENAKEIITQSLHNTISYRSLRIAGRWRHCHFIKRWKELVWELGISLSLVKQMIIQFSKNRKEIRIVFWSQKVCHHYNIIRNLKKNLYCKVEIVMAVHSNQFSYDKLLVSSYFNYYSWAGINRIEFELVNTERKVVHNWDGRWRYVVSVHCHISKWIFIF